ncbi:hypothetical protein, partial [Xanthomonas oryzae]
KYTENAPKTAKNQGFERPQRRRCGVLHFPAALIRPSLVSRSVDNCRIPDDGIDPKRYPLFMAQVVLQELIESLQWTPGAKPC